jgi:hypothetical protein
MNEPTEIPPRRRIDWVSGLMAGVTVAASLGAAWFYFGRQPSERSLVVGSPAPLLQLIDLETSEPLVLAGLHGKVVWIVFWSAGSTSGPSSLPVIARAWSRLKEHRRFGMAAAAIDSEPARVRAVVADSQFEMPVYLASPESRRRFDAEVADPPLNVLVDAEGKVAAIARGTAPQTIDRLARQASRLLEELDPQGRTRFAGRPPNRARVQDIVRSVSSSLMRVRTSWSSRGCGPKGEPKRNSTCAWLRLSSSRATVRSRTRCTPAERK